MGKVNDVFYGLVDWLDAHGIPMGNVVDALEEKGIPAMPVIIITFALILAGIGYGIYSFLGPKTFTITVYDANGNPLANTVVIVNGKEYITDAFGQLELEGIEGPISVEVPGYQSSSIDPSITDALYMAPMVKTVKLRILDKVSGKPVENASIRILGDGDEEKISGSSAEFKISKVSVSGAIKTDEKGNVRVEVTSPTHKKKIVTISWNDSESMSIEKTAYLEPLSAEKGNIVIYITPTNVGGTATILRNGLKIKETLFQNGLLEIKNIDYGTYEIVIYPKINGTTITDRANRIKIIHRSRETTRKFTLSLPGYDGTSKIYTPPKDLKPYYAEIIVRDEKGDPIEGAELRDPETKEKIAGPSDENGIIRVGFKSAGEEINAYVFHPNYAPSDTMTIRPNDERAVTLNPLPKTGTLKICAVEPWPDGSYVPVPSAYYKITAKNWTKTGNAGKDGCAKIEDVPVGDVNVLVAYPSGEFPASETAEVKENRTTKIDVTLSKTVTVQISVKRMEDGAPISASVEAVDSAGRKWAEAVTGIETGTSMDVPAYVRLHFVAHYGSGYRYETEDYVFTEGESIEINVPTELSDSKIDIEGITDGEGKSIYMVLPGKTYYVRGRVLCKGDCAYYFSGDGIAEVEGDGSINAKCNGICVRGFEIPFHVSYEGYGVAELHTKGVTVEIPYGYELGEGDAQGSGVFARMIVEKDGKRVRFSRLAPLTAYTIIIPFAAKTPYEEPIIKVDSGDLEVIDGPKAESLANIGGYAVGIIRLKAYAPLNGEYTVSANIEDMYDVQFTLRFNDERSLKEMHAFIDPKNVPFGCTGYRISYKLVGKDGKPVSSDIIIATVNDTTYTLSRPSGTLTIPTTDDTVTIDFVALGYREKNVTLHPVQVTVRGRGFVNLVEPKTKANGSIGYVIKPDLGLELRTKPYEREIDGYAVKIGKIIGNTAPLTVEKTGGYGETKTEFLGVTQEGNLVSDAGVCPVSIDVNIGLRESPANYCGMIGDGTFFETDENSGKYVVLSLGNPPESIYIGKLVTVIPDDYKDALLTAIRNGRVSVNVQIKIDNKGNKGDNITVENGAEIPVGGFLLNGENEKEGYAEFPDVIKKYSGNSAEYYIPLAALQSICRGSDTWKNVTLKISGSCNGNTILDGERKIRIDCRAVNDSFESYVKDVETKCYADKKDGKDLVRVELTIPASENVVELNVSEYDCKKEGEKFVCSKIYTQGEKNDVTGEVELEANVLVDYGYTTRLFTRKIKKEKCESIGCGTITGTVVKLDGLRLPKIESAYDPGIKSGPSITVENDKITYASVDKEACSSVWCDPVLAIKAIKSGATKTKIVFGYASSGPASKIVANTTKSKETLGPAFPDSGETCDDACKATYPKYSDIVYGEQAKFGVCTCYKAPPPIAEVKYDNTTICTTPEIAKLFTQDYWGNWEGRKDEYEYNILPLTITWEIQSLDEDLYKTADGKKPNCNGKLYVPKSGEEGIKAPALWFKVGTDGEERYTTIFGDSLDDYYELIKAIATGEKCPGNVEVATKYPSVVAIGNGKYCKGEPISAGPGSGQTMYALGVGETTSPVDLVANTFNIESKCKCIWYYQKKKDPLKPGDFQYLIVTDEGRAYLKNPGEGVCDSLEEKAGETEFTVPKDSQEIVGEIKEEGKEYGAGTEADIKIETPVVVKVANGEGSPVPIEISNNAGSYLRKKWNGIAVISANVYELRLSGPENAPCQPSTGETGKKIWECSIDAPGKYTVEYKKEPFSKWAKEGTVYASKITFVGATEVRWDDQEKKLTINMGANDLLIQCTEACTANFEYPSEQEAQNVSKDIVSPEDIIHLDQEQKTVFYRKGTLHVKVGQTSMDIQTKIAVTPPKFTIKIKDMPVYEISVDKDGGVSVETLAYVAGETWGNLLKPDETKVVIPLNNLKINVNKPWSIKEIDIRVGNYGKVAKGGGQMVEISEPDTWTLIRNSRNYSGTMTITLGIGNETVPIKPINVEVPNHLFITTDKEITYCSVETVHGLTVENGVWKDDTDTARKYYIYSYKWKGWNVDTGCETKGFENIHYMIGPTPLVTKWEGKFWDNDLEESVPVEIPPEKIPLPKDQIGKIRRNSDSGSYHTFEPCIKENGIVIVNSPGPLEVNIKGTWMHCQDIPVGNNYRIEIPSICGFESTSKSTSSTPAICEITTTDGKVLWIVHQ